MHEIGGGVFAAAVVRGDENLGVQLFRMFQKLALGGLLDIGGEQNRMPAKREAEHQAGVVGIEAAIRRGPEHFDLGTAAQCDAISGHDRMRRLACSIQRQQQVSARLALRRMPPEVGAGEHFAHTIITGEWLGGA